MEKVKIKYLIVFILIFAFLFFIGSGNVISPFYGDLNLIDEGQFGAWIMHMNNGQFLFKDTYAAYGPFYIYPFYLLSQIFEPTFFTIRIFYGVFTVFLSILIIVWVLKELKVSVLPQILTVFLLLFIPGFGLRQASGLLTILLAFLAFQKKKLRWSFFIGISLGTTFLISSDIGLFSFMVLLPFYIIQLINIKDFKLYFKKVLFSFFGCFLIFLLFYIWTSYEGWFSYYVASIIDDFRSYSGIGIAIGKKFPNALELVPNSLNLISWLKYIFSKDILNYWLILFYILSIVYFFIRFMIKKIQSIDLLAFLITLYGILLSTILIGRINNFNFVLPAVFLLFGYYLEILTGHFKKTKIKSDKIVSAFIMILILVFSLRLVSIYRPHFYKIPMAIKSVIIIKNSPAKVGNIYISQEQNASIRLIQNFINKNTKLSERVFILSNNPGLYLLVNRISPTRFDLPEVANTREKRIEIVNAIEKDKTRYIIEDTKAYEVDGISNRIRLPEVMEYIQKNYSDTLLGSYIIYKRK